jgi:hypothetical protein
VDWKYILIILLAIALVGVGAWTFELRRRLAAAERDRLRQTRQPAIVPPPAPVAVPKPPKPRPQITPPDALPATATPGALPDTIYSVPDSTTDGARLGHLVVRSAATRGERGRVDATVRRNEVWTSVLHKFDPPVLLSCVSSGVSGSDNSYLGAAQACRSLHGRLNEQATALAVDTAWKSAGAQAGDGASTELQRLLRGLTAWVGNSLKLLADERMLGEEELATGLSFLLSRLSGPPQRAHLAVSVGDGVLLRLAADGKWSSEAADTRPVPAVLPANADQLSIRQVLTEPGDVLVLCSATTAPFLLRDQEDAAVVSSTWQSGPPDLVRFLWQLNLADPIERGDRAAVALWESPITAPA